MMLGYFQNDPQKPEKQIRIDIQRRRPPDQPYGDLMIPLIGEVTQARMQDPAAGGEGGAAPLTVPPLLPLPSQVPRGAGGAAPPGLQGLNQNPFTLEADSPPQDVDAADRCPAARPPPPGRPASAGGPRREPRRSASASHRRRFPASPARA